MGKPQCATHLPCYEGKEPISAVIVVYDDGSTRILCPHSKDKKGCDIKGKCVYVKEADR